MTDPLALLTPAAPEEFGGRGRGAVEDGKFQRKYQPVAQGTHHNDFK